MEDSFNVDDLFGESVGLDLGGLPPTAAPAKGLAKRLDEMRLSGCCQYVLRARHGMSELKLTVTWLTGRWHGRTWGASPMFLRMVFE